MLKTKPNIYISNESQIYIFNLCELVSSNPVIPKKKKQIT